MKEGDTYLAILVMNEKHFSLWAECSTEGRYLHTHLKYTEGIQFVAIEGAVQDWACYYGTAHQYPEEIAHNGAKLGASEARLLFPNLQSMKYRS